MKSAIGIIAGLITTLLIIYLGHYINTYSILPPGDDLTSADWEDYLEGLPASAYIIVLFINAVAVALGGYIAQSIAKTPALTPSITIGIASIIMVIILTVIIRSHPLWFVIVNILVLLPVSLTGGQFAKRMQSRP